MRLHHRQGVTRMSPEATSVAASATSSADVRGEFLKAQRPSVAASAASSAEVRGELSTPGGHGMGLAATG